MQRRVLADVPHVIVRADAQLANRIVVVEELVGVERYQIVEDVQVVDDSDEVPFLYMSDWTGWYLCTVDDGNAMDVTVEHQLQDLKQGVVGNAVG